MSKTYRVAIIGVGAIGQLHAKAIGDLDNVELVGGFHTIEAAAQTFAAANRCKGYTNYEQMIDELKPDFVTICTPSGAHMEPALAAIERGVHVLCEKPLEITLPRIDQMISAAKKAGVTLGGIFPQRYNGVMRTIQQAAAAGRFGSLATINAYVPWWRDDAYYGPGKWQGTLKFDGGGALMNQSIHSVDLVQWIAGAALGLEADVNPVEQIFAYTAVRAHDPKRLEVEDTCIVALRFRGGALGQMLATTSLFPGSFKRFLIGGRDGTAEVLEDELTKFVFRAEDAHDAKALERFGKATSHGGGAADPMSIDYGLHTANIRDFVAALDAGHAPAIDGPEARKSIAIISAVYESAKTGKPVDVT
ncbi:MAG: gfo/Idh/MocA family oxidoreductase [Planctomycetes bacterium]|nr:gfo/Idh/MocA family oxidoreductase [Planctomycetota bacterium]